MAATHTVFDVETIRTDFPILSRTVHDKPLVYLDNAATTQKPRQVIDAVSRFYENDNANIHRGVHALSQAATEQYEASRVKVQEFLGAEHKEEIVFVRGCTEAINLVAATWGRANLREDDEILLTGMEHHSNIVPWQLVAGATGAKIVVTPVTDKGELDLGAFGQLLSSKTKLVGVTHVSNALGTINPVKEIVELAHAVGAVVLVDGAQAVPHIGIDLQDLDADFYTLSGHKVYGPTGIGALYGKMRLLRAMPPYQGGGDMIRRVSFEGTTFSEPPSKFEAGTPHMAGVVGLKAALDYVDRIGLDAISAYEHELTQYALAGLSRIPGLRLFGTAKQRCSVVSFLLDDIHPHDLGTILDSEGVAIRAGHHCAQPLMERFGVAATARASFAFYNTKSEVDALVGALEKAKELFN
jgi:cysteine desulfurase / selenocysteine lyase